MFVYGVLIHIGFVVFVTFSTKVDGVPPDYCFQTLNKSDCNMPPKAVFSYYKSGSRCEIEIWRGCPTYNKFDDEFICSHYCIGKLLEWQEEEQTQNVYQTSDDDYCHKPLVTHDCLVDPVQVYTYRDNKCVPDLWKGCDTTNKFDDELTCKETCVEKAEEHWQQKLENLAQDEVEDIKKLIDETFEPTHVKELSLQTLMAIAEVTTTVAPESEDEPTEAGDVATEAPAAEPEAKAPEPETPPEPEAPPEPAPEEPAAAEPAAAEPPPEAPPTEAPVVEATTVLPESYDSDADEVITTL